MTANDIAKIAAHAPNSPFNIKKHEAVIQNVSWGFFEWGEADLIALTKAGYLIEGEIKVTKSDFLIDSKKKKWAGECGDLWKKDIKQFYYIVPVELVEFALQNTEHGVVSAEVTNKSSYKITVHRQGKFNRGRKLFLEERNKLLRLGCFRAWK